MSSDDEGRSSSSILRSDHLVFEQCWSGTSVNMTQPNYTVYVRVPIPRGDFVDPPLVNWDSSKDEDLWKILSGAAQKEIDWSKIAQRFGAPVDFLLQQVAYLTERHASQVRAQVRKATAAARGSAAPSPVPGAEPTPTGPHQRNASALSGRRDTFASPQDTSTSGTPIPIPVRPNISRDVSANTTILKDAPGSSRHEISFPTRTADQGGRKRLSSLPIPKSPDTQTDRHPDEVVSPGPAESSSSSDESGESSPAQSRIIRRPPRFQQQETGSAYQDDGDDESEPAFQPFQAASDQTGQDMASTLKGDERTGRRRSHKSSAVDVAHQSQTSDDSWTGSPVAVRKNKSRNPGIPGPLSPTRTTEPAGRSPSGKGKAISREGSEGTPSMGSSYSDLDGMLSS
ncbi:hypothetical protein QQS21_011919 [Conoideocrella luteorostrata]|uniref:Autophagy-related protein 29 n=1 Tax=Conoideocrella luteorostrata TaxID=1105319 RepID=A0AAJ0FN47_9HYPO|nr:hypothetical protein QQS21_011919 [Conoideocrella luteorostrata]